MFQPPENYILNYGEYMFLNQTSQLSQSPEHYSPNCGEYITIDQTRQISQSEEFTNCSQISQSGDGTVNFTDLQSGQSILNQQDAEEETEDEKWPVKELAALTKYLNEVTKKGYVPEWDVFIQSYFQKHPHAVLRPHEDCFKMMTYTLNNYYRPRKVDINRRATILIRMKIPLFPNTIEWLRGHGDVQLDNSHLTSFKKFGPGQVRIGTLSKDTTQDNLHIDMIYFLKNCSRGLTEPMSDAEIVEKLFDLKDGVHSAKCLMEQLGIAKLRIELSRFNRADMSRMLFATQVPMDKVTKEALEKKHWLAYEKSGDKWLVTKMKHKNSMIEQGLSGNTTIEQGPSGDQNSEGSNQEATLEPFFDHNACLALLPPLQLKTEEEDPEEDEPSEYEVPPKVVSRTVEHPVSQIKAEIKNSHDVDPPEETTISSQDTVISRDSMSNTRDENVFNKKELLKIFADVVRLQFSPLFTEIEAKLANALANMTDLEEIETSVLKRPIEVANVDIGIHWEEEKGSDLDSDSVSASTLITGLIGFIVRFESPVFKELLENLLETDKEFDLKFRRIPKERATRIVEKIAKKFTGCDNQANLAN